MSSSSSAAAPTPAPGLSRTTKDLLAGTAGGIAQVLVGQPFDIVKVRLQTSPPGTFNGMVDCAKKLITNEGPLAFYKGTLTPLLGIGACVSIQFGALEAAKREFRRQNAGGELGYGQLYASGLIAGLANTVVAGPVEHIRIRLQAQTAKPGSPEFYSGPLDCAKKIYKVAGLPGIFKGQVPTMIRDGHGYGAYFAAYEALIQWKMKRDGLASRTEIPATYACLFGAGAGYALWGAIYPVDVIKSRIQTASFTAPKVGVVGVAQEIVRTAGWGGFVRGLIPTLIRSPIANGTTFLVFELAMRTLG